MRLYFGDAIETVSVGKLKVDAPAGDPESQCRLGFLYGVGRGVPVNRKRAVHYYSRAAEKGHVIATCNLATCYFSGKGVRKDLLKAARLYRKAALKGDHQAQCDLGIMYRFGEGIRRNRKLALYWLRRAAPKDRRALYHLGDGHVVAGNLVVATRYMRRAAALGDRRARSWLVRQQKKV
ncbi:MAG TPA: tetratricopeptide repeat protein [Planctomycetota bacterium]|nr:tetratricopeptide repeat protein [Planctomycetota bacterium]